MFFDPKTIKPGQQFQLKNFVVISPYGGTLMLLSCELEGYITLGTHEFTFTVPEGFNAVAQAVAAVDRKIDALVSEHNIAISELREKKAQLLQLSYGGNDVLDAVPAQDKP